MNRIIFYEKKDDDSYVIIKDDCPAGKNECKTKIHEDKEVIREFYAAIRAGSIEYADSQSVLIKWT